MGHSSFHDNVIVKTEKVVCQQPSACITHSYLFPFENISAILSWEDAKKATVTKLVTL